MSYLQLLRVPASLALSPASLRCCVAASPASLRSLRLLRTSSGGTTRATIGF